MMDRRIGAQLYTLRDYGKTEEQLDETFAKLKEIGYKTVQVSGMPELTGSQVRKACDKYGLEPIVTHRGYDEYVHKTDDVIKYHEELGCNICGIGSMPYNFANPDGVLEFIENMKPAVEAVRKSGRSFVYHNHAFEFQKFDGKYIMDTLIEKTDFDFVVDVYWLAYAGINPAKFIRSIGKRAKIIHFKDLAIVNNEIVMAEVLEGNLDFDEIISACDDAGSMAAFVEQDICRRNPFDSLKISYENLKAKGFN